MKKEMRRLERRKHSKTPVPPLPLVISSLTYVDAEIFESVNRLGVTVDRVCKDGPKSVRVFMVGARVKRNLKHLI